MRFLLLGLIGLLQAQPFHLKEGDRVVFFGDSITDQRLYTTFVETFVLTRFPKMPVSFVHSGWGGDRVTGGAGGGIETRLTRDVLAYNPTVVTVMLGMNDGRVRAFDQQIFDIYSRGYRNLVDRLQKAPAPPRLTVIQPSPYDDVTRAPGFPGGYNGTLLRYSEFVAGLAKERGLTLADLNRPVTAMLERAKAHADAPKIIPDRVHPAAAGHLIMAGGLLRAWNAPARVSTVTLQGTTAWTGVEEALPMAIDMADPVTALAVRSSDFVETLNQHVVRASGLSAGEYTLYIDGQEIVSRTHTDWAAGVNIATMHTPMWEQAMRVHALTVKRASIHQARWRTVETPLAGDGLELAEAVRALDGLDAQLARKQREMAQPVAHRYQLVAGGSRFRRLFNGRDLTGWHVSETNHHGKTTGWKVEDGAITGTQDKPGHGGVLLTDKTYKNFEVRMEIQPTYGCDSGLFLRANASGHAYQVMLDYLDGGSIGGVYGERLQGVTGVFPNWMDWFKRNEWNHLRARIEGETPRIQVWLNGIQITDWKDTANHGSAEGHVAVQVHGGNRWIPGGKHRFRNVEIRELP